MALKFTTCYAVTDHHMILPLRVINVTHVDEEIKIETELVGNITGAAICHHEAYFKVLWLNENGLPSHSSVFVSRTDATSYALKKAKYEMKKHWRAVELLKQQVKKLKREI